MILVDTSIWVDHFRTRDRRLEALLAGTQVLSHPFIIGEMALGHLSRRADILTSLRMLPTALQAEDPEVLAFIDRHKLFGTGIGYVDAHLLVATQLTADARLWSRDKRLATLAVRLGIAAFPGDGAALN